jgi:hypothetical protein
MIMTTTTPAHKKMAFLYAPMATYMDLSKLGVEFRVESTEQFGELEKCLLGPKSFELLA